MGSNDRFALGWNGRSALRIADKVAQRGLVDLIKTITKLGVGIAIRGEARAIYLAQGADQRVAVLSADLAILVAMPVVEAGLLHGLDSAEFRSSALPTVSKENVFLPGPKCRPKADQYHPAFEMPDPAPLPPHPPAWIKPQLAALVKQAPDGPDWLHEIKFDGYRMHAWLDAGRVQILTRRGNDWTDKYPPIVQAIAALPAHSAYLDGELCGVLPDGKTAFNLIQTVTSVKVV